MVAAINKIPLCVFGSMAISALIIAMMVASVESDVAGVLSSSFFSIKKTSWVGGNNMMDDDVLVAASVTTDRVLVSYQHSSFNSSPISASSFL